MKEDERLRKKKTLVEDELQDTNDASTTVKRFTLKREHDSSDVALNFMTA